MVRLQGTSVPTLGFRTWLMNDGSAEEGVRDAFEIGYRHIDTARAYENENEDEVGRAIAGSGVDRGDLWLTTKIFPGDFEPDRLRDAAEDSLRRLQTDYLDLLLLHWPDPSVPMEQPLLEQERLLALARENDVLVTAYSPLAHSKVPDDPTLARIGEAHGKTAGQVALRWLLDQPLVATIPKASSHERRVENFEVFDFALGDDERAEIDGLPKDVRTADPDFGPDWND